MKKNKNKIDAMITMPKIANRATHTEKILLESRTYPRDLQTTLVARLGTSVGVKVTGTMLLSE